jgi:uncharacterized protein YecE (DUF72 family)
VRIGISGWLYPRWRGTFYPEGLAQRRELEFAASRFDAIEINGTFYSMKQPADFGRWREQTPAGFVFALKGPRFITHMKKLKDVRTATANFFASGVLRLGDRLGPILWQFPERMHFEPGRFADFLELLPRDTAAAARLGRAHDDRLAGPAWLRIHRTRPIRHAFEIRHESFLCEEFIRLLRKHRAALVFADSAGRFCFAEDLTADFVYVRLHGSTELYVSGYSDVELRRWAARIRTWSAGGQPPDACRSAPGIEPRARAARDVYVFFDNDAKVHAPFDAVRLTALLRGDLRGRSRSPRST